MFEITNGSEDFRGTLGYRRKLGEIQEKALAHPENLLFQARIGNFLAELKKKAEAIAVYEQTAQNFIKENLFAHVIALKKIIFRLEPRRDDREQKLVLARLHEQILEYREQTSNLGQEPSEELIQELYRQIGQLKVDLDWLKKKSSLLP